MVLFAAPEAHCISAITYRKGSANDHSAISAYTEHETRIAHAYEGLVAGDAGICKLQP